MFQEMRFKFDDVESDIYGLMLVKINSGAEESHFGIRQSIIEEKIPNNPIPYFYGVSKETFSFQTVLCKEGRWDYDTRVKICKWLFQDGYKDFVSYDNPEVVYKVICVDDPTKVLFCNGGYITLTWRSCAPWVFTPTYLQTFDLSTIAAPTIIELENKSNIEKIYKPEIEVELVDNSTGFALKNLSNEGISVVFENLNKLEKVYLNGKKQLISSTGLYRHNNWNKKTLNLIYGKNRIEVTGKIKLKIRSQFPIAI